MYPITCLCWTFNTYLSHKKQCRKWVIMPPFLESFWLFKHVIGISHM